MYVPEFSFLKTFFHSFRVVLKHREGTICAFPFVLDKPDKQHYFSDDLELGTKAASLR